MNGAEIAALPLKVVVAGGPAVGKTTLIGTISEIEPPATGPAMDFGRAHVGAGMVLYLFGTPGQDRFRFMWESLARGATGVVVMIDTRRIEAGSPAVDYFERSGLPYVVAVNCFDGMLLHSEPAVRGALGTESPILLVDARQRADVKRALKRLLEHVILQTAVR